VVIERSRNPGAKKVEEQRQIMKLSLIIEDEHVRIDEHAGFVNLTDMAKLKSQKNASDLLRNWMRTMNSVRFFLEWELFQNPDFKTVDFDRFKNEAGSNDFFVTAGELVKAGATGIFANAGRYGGTYAHVDWAIHFANWMDPRFYVITINAFRQMSDYFVGREALHHQFSRELAAKSYNLLAAQNKKHRLQLPPHPITANHKAGDRSTMVRRYMNQVDADIINLAVFSMTALDWRSRFPQTDIRKKRRDFSTAEELLVINALHIELRVLQEDQYSPEEKRHRLRDKADELIQFFCDSPEKVDRLEKQREDRGW
jgi:hypothetical protein